jgi:hypothetical protein
LQPGGHRFDPGQLHQVCHEFLNDEGDEDMRSILDLGIWLIPIVAIIVWGATEIVKTIMHHQERSQMIARGMDPDAPHRNPEAK